MCGTPKPSKPSSPEKPVYMRNSFLDGLGINAESRGRNSLRIDRGTGTVAPPIVVAPPQPGIPGGPGIPNPGNPWGPGPGGPGNRWRLGINP